MSQLSLNQPIQSLVTDLESVPKKGIFRNSDNHLRKRPLSALTSKGGNDDNASVGVSNDFTRVRPLGFIPSYLKKQTKASVESDLVTKHKKFKIAKRELVEKQTNLMKDFEQLRSLKEKFKELGGRDFKLDSLNLIEFTGCANDHTGCGDGLQRICVPCGDGISSSHLKEIDREIRGNRDKVKDCLFKVVEFNAKASKRIQAFGSDELQEKINEIFSKVEEYVKSVSHEQDAKIESLLEKLQQLKSPMQPEQPITNSIADGEEIASLRAALQNYEVQGKMLQSEIDVKNREIEYLKNKEIALSKSIESCSNQENVDNDQEALRLEILSQKDTIDDYRRKIGEHVQLQEKLEKKILQMEDKLDRKNQQIEENVLKFENGLCEERKKYEELRKVFDEMKNANSKIIQKNGSSFELLSNQLATVREDANELKFKLDKRDKQIQSLKQMIDSEMNKAKDFDQLCLKYDELLQTDQKKSKELHQLKEKLGVRTDTINSQMLTIDNLKKKLIGQGGGNGSVEPTVYNCTGPLQDEHITKFLEHERIIKKLESNKIRCDMLRDQLLDRISMLEKENDDMKAQIRKFHEDFTINRFMYDEQRRKKRLTEILVKQYQK